MKKLHITIFYLKVIICAVEKRIHSLRFTSTEPAKIFPQTWKETLQLKKTPTKIRFLITNLRRIIEGISKWDLKFPCCVISQRIWFNWKQIGHMHLYLSEAPVCVTFRLKWCIETAVNWIHSVLSVEVVVPILLRTSWSSAPRQAWTVNKLR